MSKIEIYYTARCKDCIFRKDFYYGRKKESRCMKAEPTRQPHLTDPSVTLKTPACDDFRLV